LLPTIVIPPAFASGPNASQAQARSWIRWRPIQWRRGEGYWARSAPERFSEFQTDQGIYLPLITRWLGRFPGLGDEADDLAQEVFVVVIREIPRFQRQREGSFRAWLRQVTVNKVRTHRRRLREEEGGPFGLIYFFGASRRDFSRFFVSR
jgi:Sigma-70 region 2